MTKKSKNLASTLGLGTAIGAAILLPQMSQYGMQWVLH